MASFKVKGGNQLRGELIPQGAKNEALQIISAVLITEEKVIIENIPNIRDVIKLIELLADMGVVVEKINEDKEKDMPVLMSNLDSIDIQIKLLGQKYNDAAAEAAAASCSSRTMESRAAAKLVVVACWF